MTIVKDWLDFIKSLIGVLVIVGATVAIAGDLRWVKVSNFEASVQEQTRSLKAVAKNLKDQLDLIQINSLDKQITFLQIKIDQDEATQSEKIFIQTLRQQLRQLKSEID